MLPTFTTPSDKFELQLFAQEKHLNLLFKLICLYAVIPLLSQRISDHLVA